MGSSLDLWAMADPEVSVGSATFYVAIDGNDRWSGKLSEANTSKTDGPFATLSRARDVIREMKAKEPLTEPLTVLVRKGKYYLDRSLVFSERDGGTREFPVSYKAFPGEKVVLSGGKRITNWKPYKGKTLQSAVPGSKGGEWKFRQLFLNGEPQIRSRYPKYDAANPLYGGWLFAAGRERSDNSAFFRYQPGSFPRRWDKPQNGEVMTFQESGWTNAILPIQSIDEATNTIAVGPGYRNIDFPPIFQKFDNFDGSGDRFRVENLLEELSEPGEWCLDPEEGIVYFLPPKGQLKPTDEVVVPLLPTLVDINGASWLNLCGFIFTETLGGDDMHRVGMDGADAMTPNQGWKYCGEALHMRDASHCIIEENHFYAVGGNAIYLERYNSRNIIRKNEISHAGANGVSLLGNRVAVDSVSEPMAKGRQPMPLFNEVTDNYIHDCGVFQKYIAGVFLGVSDGNLIAHNRLERLPHHAINLGSNGFGRNLVEYNEIQYVCQEIWDTAAINSWMEEPMSDARAGHVIRFNRIMDVIGCHTDRKGNILTPDGAANGIYLDANTSNCFIQGNTIVRSSGYAVYVHGGQHNFIENNIVVDSTLNAEILPAANSGAVKYTGFSGQIGYYGNLRSAFLVGNRFCNNIVSYKQGPYPQPTTLFDFRPRGDDSQSTGDSDYVVSESNRNLFVRRDQGDLLVTQIGQSVTEKGTKDVVKTISLSDWQKQGFDRDSVQADPLFVDPDHDDYRLKPESPALPLGFVPTDMEKIGIREQQ